MLEDLSIEQRALAEYMSDLSEQAFSAAWMKDLEFDLWRALKGEMKKYGRLEFSSSTISILESLSLAANGWIYFDEEREEVFLSFDEWEKKRVEY